MAETGETDLIPGNGWVTTCFTKLIHFLCSATRISDEAATVAVGSRERQPRRRTRTAMSNILPLGSEGALNHGHNVVITLSFQV